MKRPGSQLPAAPSQIFQRQTLQGPVCPLTPGADPEDVITGAFKVLDPEGKGVIKKQL